MAFLQIITRTFGERPAMLRRNIESLATQIDPDYEHTIVLDDQTRGSSWANRNLATVEATGNYVWVLDDDDRCCRPQLIVELKEIAHMGHPDVIMVRASHAVHGTLPNDANWRHAPVLANVGWSCYIVRAGAWEAHRDKIVESYDADFWWIDALWNARCSFYWHDVIAADYPQQSIGVPEKPSRASDQ